MLENFFLTYANNSFRENPENLYKIQDEILSCLDKGVIDYSRRLVKFQFDMIIEMAKSNDSNKSWEKSKKIQKQLEKSTIDETEYYQYVYLLEQAYLYVYPDPVFTGCLIGHCENPANMKRFLKDHVLKSNVKLKCYECRQLQFISLLSALVNGEYEQLIKLNPKIPQDLDDGGNKKWLDFLKSNRSLRSINALFLSSLINSAYSFVNSAIKSDEKGKLFIEHSFNFNGMPIFSMLGYSLSQFIMNKDIKKLKRCQICGKFFISSKVDKRVKYCTLCSPKSKMSKEERNKYQREYNKRKRTEKLETEREARIENLIKRSGCSREEAIGYIEADSQM